MENNNKINIATPTESSETTVFMDDAKVIDVVTKSDYEDHITVRDTGIPAFMARPQLISTSTWTTSSAANTVLTSFSIASAMESSTVWKKKLDCFNLVRGKACIRVQMNANPFQSGRLLIHYIPCARELAATGTSIAGLWNSNLATKSTQLGFELDARATAGVLKVPYVGPNHFYDRTNVGYDWGTVYISVMSPLSTGAAGELSVDYSIFMWFEDFELAAPMYPQSSAMPGKKGTRSKMRAVSAIEREKEAKSMTPLADALSVAGKAADTLGAIPMLAPFTGPASWALKVASGAASYFGWSKPEVITTYGLMLSQTNRYSACSDGQSPAYPLALTAGNHVKLTDCCSARGEDEMSFDYLKRVPSMVASFDWSSAVTTGAVIYSAPISPSKLCYLGTTTSSGIAYYHQSGPPINYLSYNFTYWRGSIKVRMSFVKTIFHSGRLLVTFHPVVNCPSGVTYSAADTTAMLRMIVDIRDADELEFDIPFYAPSNYLLTDEHSGILQVQVLTDLRVPETASPVVSVLVSYSGGDDFELALPKASTSPGPFKTQSAMIGGDPSPSFTTEPSEQSQGEVFTSLRQILKRVNKVNSDSFPTTSSTASDAYYYWPWHSSVYAPGTTVDAVSWALNGDAYSIVSPLYAFYRGGMDVRLTNGSVTAETAMCITDIPAGTGLAVGKFTGDFSERVTGNLKGGSTAGLHFGFNGRSDLVATTASSMWVIPYSARTHCSLNSQSTDGISTSLINPIPGTGSSTGIDRSQPRTVLVRKNFSNETCLVSRSIGEDFQFSFFIGTVPRLVTSVGP